MRVFNPENLDLRTNYQLMISGIIPRPIALVSTIDKDSNVNLAPFSFYNGFGSNPPIVGFSPAFSGRTGQAKDTLLNIQDTNEFAISMVTLRMMDKMMITSKTFERGIDEFLESGFLKRESIAVRPPGVEGSPYIIECKLYDIIELGGEPGSGNLVLGQIVRYHVEESVFDDEGNILPHLFDAVGRLGQTWYSRTKDGIFREGKKSGIGFENLPQHLLESPILIGKYLKKLSLTTELPRPDKKIQQKYRNQSMLQLHNSCRELIDNDQIWEAWQVIYQMGEINE